MREYLVEFAADSAFAGRVSLALNIGGILKEREHAFFAVFGEGVQVEELVVGGSGIDLEVAGVDDYAYRAMNGEGDAIDQAVRDLDRVNRKSSELDALVGAHLANVGVIEQAMLVEF